MTLHVGQGRTVAAVTAFPVWSDAAGGRPVTTDLADVVVEECESAEVPRLLAVNGGARSALVLDGQLFEGGWQHRMAARSMLVPAGGRAEIEVACVEQGRWRGGRAQHSRGRRASTLVRAGLEVGGQHEVWRRVQRDDAGSPTGSLIARLDAPDALAETLVRRVRPLAGQAGVLLGIGGQPLALEVFDSPATLVAQLEALLRAAALDAVGAPAVATPGRRARRLVERLESYGRDPRWRRTRERATRSTYGSLRTSTLDVRELSVARGMLHQRVTHLRHPVLIGA